MNRHTSNGLSLSLTILALLPILFTIQNAISALISEPQAKTSKSYTRFCSRPQSKGYPELRDWQQSLCHENPKKFAAAIQGALQAEYECKRLFRKDRWNCSGLIDQFQSSLIVDQESKTLLSKTYKESAFSHAILSAGITHSLVRACRLHKFQVQDCHAGDDPYGFDRTLSRAQRKKLEQGGMEPFDEKKRLEHQVKCMDACERIGVKTAQDFMTHPEYREPRTIENFIHRKNQEAGHNIVHKSQKRNCQCMGPTGLCTWNICYKTLRDR